MLEQLGYGITRVASAASVLGALAIGHKVDLLCSDIMMPGDALAEAELYQMTIPPTPYTLDDLSSAISEILSRDDAFAQLR